MKFSLRPDIGAVNVAYTPDVGAARGRKRMVKRGTMYEVWCTVLCVPAHGLGYNASANIFMGV